MSAREEERREVIGEEEERGGVVELVVMYFRFFLQNGFQQSPVPICTPLAFTLSVSPAHMYMATTTATNKPVL